MNLGDSEVDVVEYANVDAMENDDGDLRLYRRRGLMGILRRQDVFHPKGSWTYVEWLTTGQVRVSLNRRRFVGDPR